MCSVHEVLGPAGTKLQSHETIQIHDSQVGPAHPKMEGMLPLKGYELRQDVEPDPLQRSL